MRIGSLFSGAGGLDMAVQSVFGGEIVWHSEIDKAASKVLEYRFPGVPNLGDIAKINWANWKPMLEVDVLCGGFPCTDVSAAGKRAGMHGTRSGLWSHMAEAIEFSTETCDYSSCVNGAKSLLTTHHIIATASDADKTRFRIDDAIGCVANFYCTAGRDINLSIETSCRTSPKRAS